MSTISKDDDLQCKEINEQGQWITISPTEAHLEFTNILPQWCQCAKGEFVDNRCFFNSPICALSPCNIATSTCSIITTGYSCKCRPNFYFMNNGYCRPLKVKPHCSSKDKSCVNKTSDPNCTNASEKLICVCPSDLEKLYPTELSNKLTVELPSNDFECIDVSSCKLTGQHCDSRTTTCVQKKNRFLCQCREGFEKSDNFFKCSDINECLDETACDKETSVCQNTFGGYKCECLPGYKNLNDHTCTVYNKCFIPKLDPCLLKYEEEKSKNELIPSIMGKDSCIFVNFDMYQCRCAPGFRFYNHPWGCEDIDECAEKTHECTPESQCVNTRGAYKCKCLPGYKMISKPVPDKSPKVLCKDIDECEEGVLTQDKGLVKACDSQNSVCRNIPGSFDCNCYAGYLSIPKKDRLFTGCQGQECCQDIDECKTNTHNCTDHCVDGLVIPNNFTCDCKALRFPKTPFECEKCIYSDYGTFGDVNATCGPGYRNATRKPLPGYGLEFPECNKIEHTMIFQKYNRPPCNIDDYKCTLSPWTVWSKCELKDNEGSQYQTRYIISGPRNCEETLIHYQKCQVPNEPFIIDWNGIILGSLCVTLIFITLAACVRRSLVRRQPRNYF